MMGPRRIRRLFHLGLDRKDVVTRETEEEIATHLALRAEQLEREGLSPEEAQAEARRRFGTMEVARRDLVRAALRRRDRVALRDRLEVLHHDLRHAWRSVVSEPGFTAVVVIVIALGVGANAAMFGILDRLLLRGPEHVREPGRLTRVSFAVTVPGRGRFAGNTFGYVTYTTLRGEARGFQGVAAYSETETIFGTGEQAEPIRVGHATWDFFPLLGVRPAVGRFFGADEDRPGAAQRVVVLGDGLWKRRFGADAGVLGRTVTIQGEPYTVIGVALAGFTGVELRRVDAWVPMSLRHPTEHWPTAWDAQWLKVVARLAPGITAADASKEATRAFRASYAGDEAPLKQATLSANPLWYDNAGEESMEVAVSRWLVGVSLIVLLVACANVANLLLARAVRRRREVGVRVALGISRGRLVRLLLAEGVMLSLLGGAAALLLVPLVGRLVRSTLLPSIEWSGALVDGRVLACAGALTALTGIVTGLVPAWQAGRRDVVRALRAGVREDGVGASRTRWLLAAAQAGFSVLLLIGAGLFARSLQHARNVDLGIEPERVLAISARWPNTDAGPPRTPEEFEQRRARPKRFYEAALARVRRMPEVAHAAIAVGTPFHSSFTVRLRVPGRDTIPRLPGGGPYVQAVSPGYFATVGLALEGGRVFGSRDREGSEPVTIVSATMARTLWPDGDAIGHCLEIGDEANPPCARVIGVVEDAHRFGLRERPAMQYYLPLGQERGFGGSRLLVRPRGDVDAVIQPVRRALYAEDPGLLFVQSEALEDALEPQFRPWRLGATLVSAFGVLALAIAAVGLYSLIAYLVASRTHEMAVRMALGARARDVVRLVLGQGMRIAAIGLSGGVVLALIAAPRLQDLLFEQSSRDPTIYLAAVVVLLAAAAVASVVPARRATRVNPMGALKSD